MGFLQWITNMRSGLTMLVSLIPAIPGGYGQEARSVLKHKLAVTHIAMSSDGKLIASGYGQADSHGPIILWDAEKGTKLRELSGHDSVVCGLTFAKENTYLISAGFDKSLRVWRVEDGKQAARIDGLDNLTDMTALGKDLIATYQNLRLYLWDISNPVSPKRVRPERDFGNCNYYCFSSDGKLLITGENSGLSELAPKSPPTVSVWQVSDGKRLNQFDGQEKNNLVSMGISQDNKTLALGYFFLGDANVEVRDIATGKIRFSAAKHKSPPQAFAFSPDGHFLVSGDYGGTLILWDCRKGTLKTTMEAAHSKSAEGLIFSPTGDLLISGSFDHTVKIWKFADLANK